MRRLGVLIATLREAAPLLHLLRIDPPDEDRPGMRFAARQKTLEITVSLSGFGPSRAAAATAALCRDCAVERILNFGIAGLLVDHLPHGLYVIREARYAAKPTLAPWPVEPGPWGDLPSARLVTCDAPVFDTARRRALASLGELVDMEGAAVAEAAQAAGIPCTLLKGVTDRASDGERPMLYAHLDGVSGALAHLVHTRLDGALFLE